MRRSAMHPHGDLRSQRLGKHLFVELGDGPWLLMHLGMTGSLKYYEDALEEPAHARVLSYFGSGYHLAFSNQRLFGKVDLIQDPDGFIWEHAFGLDPRWIPRPGTGEEITIEVTGLPHGTSLSSSVCRWSIDARTTFIT